MLADGAFKWHLKMAACVIFVNLLHTGTHWAQSKHSIQSDHQASTYGCQSQHRTGNGFGCFAHNVFTFTALTWTKSASCANQISQIIISLQTTKINQDARTSRFVEGSKTVQSCSKKVNNSWHSCTQLPL